MGRLFLTAFALITTAFFWTPTAGAGASSATGERVAQTVLAVTLQHGEAISVRRSLDALHAGDFVSRLEGYARAARPGSYLEVIFDNRIVGHISLPQEMATFIVPVQARNGVDYQSFYLRAVGSVYVDSIEAYIRTSPPPLEPVPPAPPTPTPPPLEPVPPHPGNPGHPNPPTQPPHTPPGGDASLAGSCNEADNRQFFAARNFAHAMNGLAMPLDRATTWATDYNRSHACGTIEEYRNRFAVLYDIAVSPRGLNMNRAEALDFVFGKIEITRLEKARELGPTLNAIRDFAYSAYGLGLSPVATAQLGREWLQRTQCENASVVQRIASRYRAEFEYAYSRLQYDSVRAKDYALVRVRPMSVCGDLFR